MCFLNLPTFFCGESVMVVIRKYIEQVGGQLYGRVFIFRDFDPHPVHENLKQDIYVYFPQEYLKLLLCSK